MTKLSHISRIKTRQLRQQNEDTVKVAGKEVTVYQKPFVEADAKAANKVLSKLMQHSTHTTEVSSVTRVSKIISDE